MISYYLFIFFQSLLLLSIVFVFCWLRWTSPEIARDDVAEDDFPVCGRWIIDVKLVAERLGRGCYGYGEKLHRGDILLENGSGLA